MKSPLISFVTHGRNDGFMGDFVWRVSTCINQIARNYAALGRLDDIEILIGDWGSEQKPLREVMQLEPAASRVTRFCTVPPAVAARLNRDGDYGYSPAANIPIRRATGKFIFSMDSDAWMPLKTADYLLQIAEGKNPAGVDLDKAFFWASRQHIPYSFISTSPSIEALDRYLIEDRDKLFWTGKCNLEKFGGGAVAIFGRREHFFAIRGYNEALVHWGWHDIDIHCRMAMSFAPHDLWDMGAEMFHMEHYPKRGGAVAGGRKMTPQVFPKMQIVNGPDWGAINEPVDVAPVPGLLPAVVKNSSWRPRNIVISGTNFWNPGDDFVRDGIVRVLREVFPGEPLNFLFYNFNADFFPQNKFAGIGNYLAKGDLDKYRDQVDAVVIAGLSAGDEIKDLYRWIVANGLEEKVYLVGAGYENDYVARYIGQEPEATIFRKARVVTGRTARTPDFIKSAGIPYHHINCPAILSVPEVKSVPAGRQIERIGFSIQLPPGEGVANHCCDRRQYELAVSVLRELARDYAVEVVAHHKTEYFHFLNLLRGENIPVIFSSFYQDLHQIYPRYDLVITTRLHASLFANGHGIPGIILNDTERHTHTLEGFSHSIWVNNRESFDQAFARWTGADLGTVARELRDFKTQLLAQYVTVLRPVLAGGATRSNQQTLPSAGRPRGGETPGQILPVHFFTIVLNGLPFIRHHINEFKRLPFQWHWHIVEGVAELNHDTGWSKAAGGKIPDTLHRGGLSLDGTTEYLDALQKEFPEHVTLYRPPAGKFWDGKREMVNAPLANIGSECLLWQVDVDELWTFAQITRARAGFLAHPTKTAAYFYCHFFVGPELVVTSRGTYGNNAADAWLRLWRYQPGDRWIAHEPPHLGRGKLDVAAINPFRHAETEAMGLVYQHYAYAIEAQLRFKESYYGYAGAVNQWRKLQAAENFPQRLGNHFGWVNDEALVNRIEAAGIKRLVPDEWLGISGAHRGSAHSEADQAVAARNVSQAAVKKGMKVAEDYAHEKDLTKIDGDSEFARTIRNLFKIYQPRRIIETGTYLGNGTTRVITGTLRDLSVTDAVFHSIEINPDHFAQAKANLQAAGLAGFVKLHRGLSVPRSMLPTVAQIEESTVRQPEYDDIFVDHREAQRARLYFAETNFSDCADDLVGAALAAFDNQPDFVLLDSGGHMGFVEFQYLIQKLAGPCLIALDDIHHIKHHKSFQLMRRDPRFELLVESKEKFGFCIAQFTPAAGVATPAERAVSARPLAGVERILFVRTDAIGDAVLASAMLEPIRREHPQAKLAVLCQMHVAELFIACPFVDSIICYDHKKMAAPAEREEIISEIAAFQPDVILNPVRSRDQLSDELTLAFAAATHIAIEGDLDNISETDREQSDARYELLIPSEGAHKMELERHADFLRGLGIEAGPLQPVVWTSPADEASADAFLRGQGLDSAKTIAVFPGAQNQKRIYGGYAEALKPLEGFRFLIFGDAAQNHLAGELERQLPGRTVNLCGRTTLREMAALLRRCRLYVGAESAGAHIACAVGVPNVVLLGGGHFGRFMPYSAHTSAVALPLHCYGCRWHCKYSSALCLESLEPRVLATAIAATLRGRSTRPRIFAQVDEAGLPAAQPALAAWLAMETVEIIPVKGERPIPNFWPSLQYGRGVHKEEPGFRWLDTDAELELLIPEEGGSAALAFELQAGPMSLYARAPLKVAIRVNGQLDQEVLFKTDHQIAPVRLSLPPAPQPYRLQFNSSQFFTSRGDDRHLAVRLQKVALAPEKLEASPAMNPPPPKSSRGQIPTTICIKSSTQIAPMAPTEIHASTLQKAALP